MPFGVSEECEPDNVWMHTFYATPRRRSAAAERGSSKRQYAKAAGFSQNRGIARWVLIAKSSLSLCVFESMEMIFKTY